MPHSSHRKNRDQTSWMRVQSQSSVSLGPCFKIGAWFPSASFEAENYSAASTAIVSSISAMNFSASSAAIQPIPALVTA